MPPLDPIQDRRPPMTPQLAARVAAVGVLALVLFGVLFFRLWYLDVLDAERYLAEARGNRLRVERVPAARGHIVDANGLTLVDDRRATVVALDPRSLPASMRDAALIWGAQMAARARRPRGRRGPVPPMPRARGELRARYRRLGRVLRLSPRELNAEVVASLVRLPYGNVRLGIDVPRDQRDFIEERREQFPGVVIGQVPMRAYPYGALAAQLLGTVRQITAAQLGDPRHKGVAPGADIGQNGLEAEYDRVLRGSDGEHRIEVNAAGQRRRAFPGADPRPGETLALTLDVGLQRIGEAALRRAGATGAPNHGGAFVAMNPETGAVYAMGSVPSYDPAKLNGHFRSQAAYDQEFGDAAGAPQLNRAFQAAYPTGSIFKPITALAAMDAGVMSPGDVFDDQGCFRTGARAIDVSCNAGKVVNGRVDLVDALRVSSDTYFYNLGLGLYRQPGQPLQRWARRLGLGRRTGIDLPYEREGVVPGPDWIRGVNAAELACRRRRNVPSCGYGTGNARWNPGDETNMAVGQGDVQATPLQMAVVYSALVNGGVVPRPHLAERVIDARGLVQRLIQPPARRVAIDPIARAAIMKGLSQAANVPGGTSTKVFAGWPRSRFPVWGKTGTAERKPQVDQSWYAVYAHDGRNPDARPIVVVATIEQGGFGAAAAAPATRLILSKWFNVPLRWVTGDSRTR